MKLKYQMRGLGIGMVVTALLMGIATKEGVPLSDAEIRARAVELGMVDSGSLSLKDVQGAAEPTAPPASVPAEVSGNEGESAEKQDEANGSGESESEEPDENDVDAGAEVAAASDEKVTVVIEWGKNSDAVSRLLAQAGLIEDAGRFDSYLCGNGYSVKIYAGTYEINMGATEEEIIQIITKSR